MTISHLSVDDLYRIAAAGGGFRVSAKQFSVNDLYRIAAAAGQYSSRIIVEDCKVLSVNDMYRVAAAGNGSVFFE